MRGRIAIMKVAGFDRNYLPELLEPRAHPSKQDVRFGDNTEMSFIPTVLTDILYKDPVPKGGTLGRNIVLRTLCMQYAGSTDNHPSASMDDMPGRFMGVLRAE